MKQTLAMLFVTALLLFSLAGCGEKKDSNTANTPPNSTTDNGTPDSDKNDTAPIFEIADYGICGDLFKVTPMLIEAFKAAKASK